MDRNHKKFRLRPVDEPAVRPSPPGSEVVRLETGPRRTRPPSGETGAAKSASRTPPIETRPARHEPDRPRVEPKPKRSGLRPDQDLAALMDKSAATSSSPEEEWAGRENQRKPAPWGWFLLVGLAAAGGVVWALSSLRSAGEAAVLERAAASAMIRTSEEDYRTTEAMVERLHAAITAYCDAETVDDLSEIVRHPQRVRPLMESYYETNEITSAPLERILRLEPTILEDRTNFWVARLETGGRAINLLLEADDEDVRIDWETAVCHQPMDWDRFVADRPVGSQDFRVFLAPDNLYSHEFVNASQWLCFRLTALNSPEFAYGYARKESETGRRLAEIAQRHGGTDSTLLLRLTVPEGLNSPRGVVIERIISPFWVLLDDPGADP
jgi:hypothetical protein